MKKWVYIIASIIIIIIAIFVGNYLFKNNNQKNKTEQNQSFTNTKKEINQKIENNITNEISISSIDKEKISPNATLTLKKHYEECDHIIKEYAKIPEEYVNLTKEELQEQQEEWEIETFSSDEVVLIKHINGVCNEHYVLREKDGLIAIYQIQDNNEETFKEETGISVEYLTETDKLRLEEGIRIYGEEELNSTLEDYE